MLNLVMTDNGSAYRSHLLTTACRALGAKPIKTRPYNPLTNVKAERFTQASPKKWTYAKAYDTSAQREALLQPWLDYYNTQHLHIALSYKPPASRLANCEQRLRLQLVRNGSCGR